VNKAAGGLTFKQSLDEATVSAILNEKLNNLDFKKQKYLLKVCYLIHNNLLLTQRRFSKH
jgi:hypothetical protein